MATSMVRWGVLSTAGINDSLIPGLLGAHGCQLTGIASRSPEKAASEAQRWGCAPYSPYEALLADESIDAVYISLPNQLHAEWTIRALQAGKHVLCEKPLAISVTEVDGIAAAARQYQRLVLEAFMYRHAPRWLRAMELVRDGAVGEPRLAKVVFAFVLPTDANNIRFKAGPGGGMIWDMVCYGANMARGILGREPSDVFAFGHVRPGQPTNTSVAGIMRFADATVMAPFAISFDFRNPFAQVEVQGTGGWLSLPGTGFRRETYTKLLLFQEGEVYVNGREPKIEMFPFDDPYTREVEHLSEAIRGEHPLAWGLDDARANIAVVEAIDASLRLNQPVPVGG
jgi:D-xylose 1-dehydrogenase (NADP+, D-xylono-1,5-lactone-forming)